MNLSFILFLIVIFGFVLNRKNIILMLISIEIMLQVVTFLILTLIILPLLKGSIISGFFGRKVDVTGSHIITCTCVIVTIRFLILVTSLNFDDILGQIYAIYIIAIAVYIIAIAGAESAIGLGILVAFYRLRGSVAIEFK